MRKGAFGLSELRVSVVTTRWMSSLSILRDALRRVRR
jgi:hypothetical protein